MESRSRVSTASNGGYDLAARSSVFDRREADVPRHDDAAAMAIECAPRIDLEIPRPFESVAAVADGETQFVVSAAEFDVGAFAAILRQFQPPRDFLRPRAFRQQRAFVVVRDAEISVLDG